MDILYKYVVPERADILENNRIRFTQPKYLNDPFDLNISFRRLIPKEDFDAIFSTLKIPEKIISTIKENLSNNNFPYTIEQILELQGKNIEEAKNEMIKILNYCTSFITTENDFVKNYLNEGFSKLIGTLSLTETPDNFPMWTHYSKDHQGFVIIFNAKHNYFNGGYLMDQEFGVIRKVTYPEEKIILDSFKEINGEPLFQKHKSWEYENEWRMLLPLDKSIELKDPDIHLFEIPPDIITGIIFGYRCDEKLKSHIYNLREKKSYLNQIEIFEAVPDLDKYKMKISKLA